jgi:hypothetical protein
MTDAFESEWIDNGDALLDRVMHRTNVLRWHRRALAAGVALVALAVPFAAASAYQNVAHRSVRVEHPHHTKDNNGHGTSGHGATTTTVPGTPPDGPSSGNALGGGAAGGNNGGTNGNGGTGGSEPPPTGETTTVPGPPPPGGIPTMTVAPASVVEGNSGTTMMHFNVMLSAPTDHDVTFKSNAHVDVEYNDYAVPGRDFLDAGVDVSHTIPARATSTSIDVPVVGDTLIEGNEQFDVLVWSAQGAQIVGQGDVTVAGTIIDDDSAATGGTYPIDVSNPSATEGDTMTFTLSLQGTSAPVQVAFATQDGTAIAGQDYTAKQGHVTITNGTATVTIKIRNDQMHENDETFQLVVSGAPPGYTIENAGVGLIHDND